MIARVAAIFCFIAALGVDRISKTIAANHLSMGESVSFLYGTLQFHLVENDSGFLGYYSILTDNLKSTILTWGTGGLLLLLLIYLIQKKEMGIYCQSAIACILAGGVGNLVDRLLNDGGVIDFILLSLGPFQTGIFNFADTFILLGSVYLGYSFASTERQAPL